MALKLLSKADNFAEIIDIAKSYDNFTEKNLLVLYGRILQAAADNQITFAEAKALKKRTGFDFAAIEDEIEVASTGLTGPQIDAWSE